MSTRTPPAAEKERTVFHYLPSSLFATLIQLSTSQEVMVLYPNSQKTM